MRSNDTQRTPRWHHYVAVGVLRPAPDHRWVLRRHLGGRINLERRHLGSRIPRRECEYFTRLQPYADWRIDVHGLAGDEFRHLRRVESRDIPFHCSGIVAVKIGQNQDWRTLVAQTHHGNGVAVASRDETTSAFRTERGMSGENAVQTGDEVHHVVGRAPVEVAPVMHVYLFSGVPFHAVGDSPCALMAEERGKLHTQARVHLTALRKTVVVMRLGEVYKRPVLLGAFYSARQIPLKRTTVVCLEYLGVRPVEVGARKQGIRDLELAAKSFEHEHSIGVFFSHASDDVRPSIFRNHVASVAAESIDSEPAPEEEHLRHVGAKLRLGVI